MSLRRWTAQQARGVLLATALVFGASGVSAQSGEAECGNPFRNHFGPFDYRTASKADKDLVERAHFTPKVESLRGGNTTMTAGGDMAYTLNVFPNHHRALLAMIKLGQKEKTNRPRDFGYSIECRFDRAERFAPNDAVVKSLHGVYLMQKGLYQDARKKFEEALELSGDNANIHYNLGLAYFELKDYDKALASAHKAYQLGFQLPGLRNKLEKAGKWREPSPAPVSQEGPSPSSGPSAGGSSGQ